jgi:cell division protein FtsL
MSNRAMVSLVSLLMICALLLVNSQFQARRLFVELERSQLRQKELETEWSQLQLDQSNLAKHERVDSLARTTLGMSSPSANKTHYITAGAK